MIDEANIMKTIIDFKNNNIYTRYVSVFHEQMLLILIILILRFKSIISLNLETKVFIFGIILFSALFFNYFQFRYYIIKIILNNDKIIISYYTWFKLKIVEIDRNEMSISFEKVYSHYYKLVIYKSNKKILTQYSKYKLAISEWTEDKLKYTYDELNRIISEI